ncbi:hypothetical protein AMK10_23935 [Streptomyces sp. CB02058]|nr:hypothetical protein AMK10_23935 [Streptomyces sp. CB02058]
MQGCSVADEAFHQSMQSGFDLREFSFEQLLAAGAENCVEEVLCLPPGPGLGEGGESGTPLSSKGVCGEDLCQLGMSFAQALEQLPGFSAVRFTLVRQRQRLYCACVGMGVAGS